MTAGRKGIPYDLSQFATHAALATADEVVSDDLDVIERVLVAA